VSVPVPVLGIIVGRVVARMARAFVAVAVLIRVVVPGAVMSTPVPIAIAAFPLVLLPVMVSVFVPVAGSVAF
jgi:hypothetical protein